MRSPINAIAIAGVRPQFIKLAAFQRAVSEWNSYSVPKFQMTYVNSGQHYDYDLAGRFIRELDIHFDIDLTNSYSDLRPMWMMGDMIAQLYDVIANLAPTEWVIVFGDTNTTLAGALAAVKRGLRVIHVEAGSRTGDMHTQEEVNRVVCDRLSTVHFATSRKDLSQLESEGLAANAFWTGDLIGDLVQQLLPTIAPSLDGYSVGEYILSSMIRDENVNSDETLRNVLYSLSAHGRKTVFIEHPKIRKRMRSLGLHQLNNIQYVDSLPYKTMLAAIRGCAFLVTDAGGIQRESYYLHRRCVIRQDTPFWPSLVNSGVHVSVGRSLDELNSALQWAEQAASKSEYPTVDDLGDGNAGKRILQCMAALSRS